MKPKIIVFAFILLRWTFVFAGEDHVPAEIPKRESHRHRNFSKPTLTPADLNGTCVFQYHTSPDGPRPSRGRKIIVRSVNDLLERCHKIMTNSCPGGVVLGGHAEGRVGTNGLLNLSRASSKNNLIFFPSSKVVRQEMANCFKRISKPLAEHKVPLTFASCGNRYKFEPEHFDFLSYELAKDLDLVIRTSRGYNEADFENGHYGVAEHGWSWSYPNSPIVHCEDGVCWSWKNPHANR